MQPRLRSLLLNLAVSGLSLVVCLAFAEAALRVFAGAGKGGKEQLEKRRYIEYDPVLGWRKTPGARAVYDRRDFHSEFRINSRGLRGPERSLTRTTGSPRILALGDSFVEAFMLNDEPMLTARLEARLLARGCRAEVINAGTSGYSTDQEYLFYREEGRKYQSDVVVLFVYHNDVPALVVTHHDVYAKPLLSFDTNPPRIVNLPLPRQVPPAASRTSAPVPAPPRSYLLEFVKDRIEQTSARTYNRIARTGLWEPLLKFPMNDELLLYRVPELGHLRPAWSMFTWTLQTLSKAVADDGARLVVAYIPSRMEVSRRHWEITEARYEIEGTSFDRHAVAERMRYITARLGLALVDLTQPLSAADGWLRPVYFATDSHWNTRGQDVAAAAVADALLSQRALPGCPY